MPRHEHVESALRVAREAGGLNMLHVPHLRPKKIREPRAEKFEKHLNAGVHTGPIHSTVAGRTDHLPMGVPSGSYVLSADVVSHLGENNTAAGFANLKRMFGGTPRGGGSQPYNHEGGPYGMADGGTATNAAASAMPNVCSAQCRVTIGRGSPPAPPNPRLSKK